MSSLYCILAAQKKAKYRDSLIKYQEIWFTVLNHLHRPMRIVGCLDLIAFLAEDKSHECRSKTIVINDKNVHHLPLFSLSGCSIRQWLVQRRDRQRRDILHALCSRQRVSG